MARASSIKIVTLHRCQSERSGGVTSGANKAFQILHSRRWHQVAHQANGGLTQHSSGFVSVHIAIDASTWRIQPAAVNTSQLQRPRVGDGNMTTDAIEQYWLTAGNLIKIRSSWQVLLSKGFFIKASAQDPFLVCVFD